MSVQPFLKNLVLNYGYYSTSYVLQLTLLNVNTGKVNTSFGHKVNSNQIRTPENSNSNTIFEYFLF